MMGEFERAARQRNVERFAVWQRTYNPPQTIYTADQWALRDAAMNGFTAGEIQDAQRFAEALERPTLAMLDTVEQLVRAAVIDMLDSRTDAQGLTAHDRKMFSTLGVKY